MDAKSLRDCLTEQTKDVFSTPTPGPGFHFVAEAGPGGCLIRPADPPHRRINVLHLFPHAGTDFHEDFKPLLRSGITEEMLTQSILANYDAGTPTLAYQLLGRILDSHDPRSAREGRWEAIAVFQVANVFADPNRAKLEQCVPSKVYRGVPPLRPELQRKQREDIMRNLVLPWVEAIESLIQEFHVPLVIHHHTFDEYPNPLFRGSHVVQLAKMARRPTAELFYEAPRSWNSSHLLDEGMLNAAREMFFKGLLSIETRLEVSTDETYRLSELDTPLLRRRGGLPFQAFVYEVRKDLMIAKNIGKIADVIDQIIQCQY